MSDFLNAMKENFEEIQLFGNPVLMHPLRIDPASIPKGLYKYEIREEDGEICQISKKILVDHWGTIISNKKIELNNDGYRYIDEDKDIRYIGKCHNIKEYMKAYPIKNRALER